MGGERGLVHFSPTNLFLRVNCINNEALMDNWSAFPDSCDESDESIINLKEVCLHVLKRVLYEFSIALLIVGLNECCF